MSTDDGAMPDKLDDAELARRAGQGDRSAATVLVERYQGLVRAFLRRLTGRMDVADDLAQETLIRMLRHADRYDPSYPMRTWLLTIARRLSINLSRKADSRVTSTEYLGMRSGATDPAESAADRDERRALRAQLDLAMAELTEPQRAALTLFHQEDMGVDEIAAVLEMPVGTVKSHLHRGRAAMRKILGSKLGITET